MELNILKPTCTDLYPTPDERELIEQMIGPWEYQNDESGRDVHRYIRRRVLKALRIGYHANVDNRQDAYNRGYAAAESDILAKTT